MSCSWYWHICPSAKYPLTILDCILDVFGANVGIGYNIGCSFSKTVQSSSLTAQAATLNIQFAVPSFHGYACNRRCQLSYHPLYMTGFGLEDMETCKRMFSAFNGLVPATWYSSSFHQHQAINMFAHQWDDDKYEELCTLLLRTFIETR